MSKESVNEGLAAGIECGGDYLSVAVASYRSVGPSLEFKLIDCVTEHRGHRHADVVLGELSGLLATHDLASEDINMVASGRGPGGFTGVRVGLATAQGLAMGWNVPFWGVCSLETLALNDCEAPGVVAAMIDARRGQIYSALFGVDHLGARICLAEPVVDEPQSVATRYEDLRQGAPIRFLGSGALAYGFAEDADARRHPDIPIRRFL